MTAATETGGATRTATDEVRIDFLFLDLETCTRCRGTDASLELALDALTGTLAAAGTEVAVNKVHVTSAQQARELRFVSSPTLRVNDRDIALELRESSCGSEACTDGCGGSIACRVWIHEGQEYTQPPVGMIVGAVLREIYDPAHAGDDPEPAPYELPENLKRFFAGSAAAGAGAGASSADQPAQTDCCSAAEQSSCCEPERKAECCGAEPGPSCGCR